VTPIIQGAKARPTVGEQGWTVIYRENGNEEPSYQRTMSRREAFNLYDQLLQSPDVSSVLIWETICVMTWHREC